MAAAQRRGRRGRRRDLLRDDRLLARPQAQRRARRPTSPTPRARCCSTSARGEWDGSSASCSGSIPASLPEPLPSPQVYGGPTREFGGEVPVAGIAGDQQAALFGQACHAPGEAKNTYGTGSFVLLNGGDDSAARRPRACSATIAWGIGGRASPTRSRPRLRHRRGGAVAARRARPDRERGRDRDAGARRSTRNDDVYFVPALTGLGSPYWDPYARGTIVGLTRGTDARAPRPRGARGDRLPDRRRGARAGGAAGERARRAAGRRRRGRQRLADAVPGRRARRAGRRPGDHRDDRLRRRHMAGITAGSWTAGRGRVALARGVRFEPQMSESRRTALLDEWAATVQTVCAGAERQARERTGGD